MIDNSIKIQSQLLSLTQSPTQNYPNITISQKSNNNHHPPKKQNIQTNYHNTNHPNKQISNFLFKQTQSHNCTDNQQQISLNSLCSSLQNSHIFQSTQLSSIPKNQNINNHQINPKIESPTNLKVQKQKVRKVSQQIATFQLLNLQQTDYQNYKQKSKLKNPNKINSKTLYNSHKHNLSYKTIKQNNNHIQIQQEISPENHNHNPYPSPNFKNRLSTSPTKMRTHMSQHLSNFQLLKLQAQKLNKSNILINTPGYSKNRPNSSKKQQQKNIYYHNYIFHNHQLPQKNKNINRKISHQTISSNHKNSNKTIQTFNQNKNITNKKQSNPLKNQTDQITQPRLTYKHKKNNSNIIFSKNKNQTGYPNLSIPNQKNHKNCNKSCSQFYNNQYQNQNIQISIEQEKIGNNNEQYLISNEFVPFVSRSIWDKNRKNIKKIGNGVNKILNIKNKFNRTLKQTIKQGIKTNQNINKFIKSKLNLLQNNDINYSKEIYHRHKRIPTSTSFYDHKQLSIGFQKNDNILKQTNHNQINQYEISKSAPKTFNQNKNPTTKVTNAQKFYKAQQEKHQAKSQLLVVDPLLKTKAIEMGSKQQKKNNDIVIICF